MRLLKRLLALLVCLDRANAQFRMLVDFDEVTFTNKNSPINGFSAAFHVDDGESKIPFMRIPVESETDLDIWKMRDPKLYSFEWCTLALKDDDKSIDLKTSQELCSSFETSSQVPESETVQKSENYKCTTSVHKDLMKITCYHPVCYERPCYESDVNQIYFILPLSFNYKPETEKFVLRLLIVIPNRYNSYSIKTPLMFYTAPQPTDGKQISNGLSSGKKQEICYWHIATSLYGGYYSSDEPDKVLEVKKQYCSTKPLEDKPFNLKLSEVIFSKASRIIHISMNSAKPCGDKMCSDPESLKVYLPHQLTLKDAKISKDDLAVALISMYKTHQISDIEIKDRGNHEVIGSPMAADFFPLTACANAEKKTKSIHSFIDAKDFPKYDKEKGNLGLIEEKYKWKLTKAFHDQELNIESMRPITKRCFIVEGLSRKEKTQKNEEFYDIGKGLAGHETNFFRTNPQYVPLNGGIPINDFASNIKPDFKPTYRCLVVKNKNVLMLEFLTNFIKKFTETTYLVCGGIENKVYEIEPLSLKDIDPWKIYRVAPELFRPVVIKEDSSGRIRI